MHANLNMAYSTPSLAVSKLVGSENQMNDLLSITELTPSEWSAKFEVYNQLSESISGLEMARRLGYLDCPSPTSMPWKKDRGRVHEEAIINQPAYIYIPKVNNESYLAMEEEAGVVTADIINHVDEGIVNLRHDLEQLAIKAHWFRYLFREQPGEDGDGEPLHSQIAWTGEGS